MSRPSRARSIDLLAAVKYLGRAEIAEMVDGMANRAQEFADRLKESVFHVLNDVVFYSCLFRCASPDETIATLRNIQTSQVMWCGGTVCKTSRKFGLAFVR